MAILVSGGAGYIGSHTCIELLNAGYDVVVADNYYNASPVVLDRVKQITGKDFRFYQADMTKHEDVEKIFAECPDITAVIQFAAYKAVGESVSKPIEYYYNNLNCTLVILDVMRKHNCHNFVFSSSATVYGDPASVPITEDFPVGATTNPYGTTKAMTERILTDVCKADPTLNVALLRYFNPIGAHKSGLIGEDPNGIPNNLMPYIAKVAVGKLEKVHVFGNDYPTPDGTGVRDYIHVVDLARGHVCAIKKLETNCGLFICNLGTGKGYSVLDVIHAFEKACGKPIPYVIEARRPGHIADGSAAEQAAAKAAGTEVSPFFEGGKADWVYSLTTLAAPHNGTTFLECCDNMAQFAAEASTAMAKLLGISDFKGVYDFQLEQFGFYRKDGETVLEALDRVLHSDFLSHNDNVFRDLTIDRALELNDDIEIQPNVYYFSYAGDKTRQNSATGERTSAVDMTPLFVPFANRMCSYYDQTTAGGFRIDKTWAPNDGLVNTVSALYPTHSDSTCLTGDGARGWKNYNGYTDTTFRPGLWYVMPVQTLDHIQFIGGMLNGSILNTRALYRDIVRDIYSTYP